MEFLVRFQLNEQTIHANVKSTETIQDIKARYFAEVYRQGKYGRELQNENTVEYYHITPDSVILVAEQMQQQHSGSDSSSNISRALYLDDLQGISLYVMVFLIGLWYFGITNPGAYSIIIWCTLILITGAFVLFRMYIALVDSANN